MHRPTCARTRAGRLARLDEDLVLEAAQDLVPGAVVVDVGFGATPVTTRELAARVPQCVVVGVDADPRNVPPPGPGPRFVVGGFELPAFARPAAVIRLMNVLRGYPPEEADPARATLGAALVEGGLLIEGTCGPTGDVLVAGWWRRRGEVLRCEALLFSTDFTRGFAPLLFRDRLPRDLRGLPDPALRGWFADWCAAYDEVRGVVGDARARFVASAEVAAARRPDVLRTPHRWAEGRLWWRPPPREVTVRAHVAPPPRLW